MPIDPFKRFPGRKPILPTVPRRPLIPQRVKVRRNGENLADWEAYEREDEIWRQRLNQMLAEIGAAIVTTDTEETSGDGGAPPGPVPPGSGGTGVAVLSDILGTINQVNVTDGANTVIGGDVTLSLPQDIHFEATPQFAAVTLLDGERTTSRPLVDGDQTWNNTFESFTALDVDITDTGSLDDSYFANWKTGGTPRFQVFKTGDVKLASSNTSVSRPLLHLVQEWDASLVDFDGLLMEITDTNSFLGSNAIRINIDGTDIFKLLKSGAFIFVDNVNQVFNPGVDHSGLNVGQVGADPTTLINGDVWYNTSLHKYRGRLNGVSVSFATLPVSLTTDVTGILPLANGGTNKALTAVAGAVVWTDADSMELTAAGLSGEVLVSQGTGSPIWQAASVATAHTLLSATHTDTAAQTVSRGSLIVGKTATPVWDELTVGIVDQVLKTDGTDVAWGAVNLSSANAVSGVLGALYGGTGLAGTVQGTLIYGSAVNTYSLLTKDTNATRYLANTGTSNNPMWDRVNLTNGVTGVLPIENGGTGNGTFSEGVILYDGVFISVGTLPEGYGGTGNSSYVVGDLLYADGTTSLARLADVVTGNALISGGVATAPSWGKIGLTTHISGILPVANGGTGVGILSDITGTTNEIEVSSGTGRVIGGNVSIGLPTVIEAYTIGFSGELYTYHIENPQLTADESNYDIGPGIFFLLNSDASRTVHGISNSVAGKHLIIANNGSFNIVFPNQSLTASAENRFITGTGSDLTLAPEELMEMIYDEDAQRWRVSAKLYTATGGVGPHNLLSATHTDTNAGTVVRGDLIVGSDDGTPKWERLALGAAGKVIRSNGSDALYSTFTMPDTYVQGDILYASAANVLSALADVATGNALISGGVGVAPSWGKIGLSTHVSGDLPFANLTQIDGLSVLGVTGSSLADVAAITAGTDHQVLRRSGSALTFGAVNLAQSAAVTGTLAATNGGTGQSSYAVGDLLYASTTTALSKLADVATGNALISGGVNTAPSWGKIGLTTHVSGTLAVTNGGTGVTDLSDILGTTNQVSVASGTDRVIGGNVTLSLPQDIHTGATPRFAALGLGETAPAAGLELTGKTINTDVTNTVGAADLTFSVTKNDTNTRTFHGVLIKPTLNTGGSNTNTTINVLEVDTINTAVTGLTTNLLKSSYGGTERARFTATGDVLELAAGTTTGKIIDATASFAFGGLTAVQIDVTDTSGSPEDNYYFKVSRGAVTQMHVTGTGVVYCQGLEVVGGIPADTGGTGLLSYTQGDMLYYNSGVSLSKLGKDTNATRYLSNTGTNNNPAWAQVNLTNGVTGTLPVSSGGTGTTSFTAGRILLGDGSNAITTDSDLSFVDGVGVLSQGARFAARAGSATEGDIWNDSTQKALQAFVNGVEQTISKTLFVGTADGAEVSNTTTETNATPTGVGTLSLPANFMLAGKVLRFSVRLLHVADGSPTLTVKIKKGSAVIAQAALAPGINAYSESIIEVVATSATVTRARGHFITYPEGSSPIVFPVGSDGSISTSAESITITLQWSAASMDNIAIMDKFIVEVLN